MPWVDRDPLTPANLNAKSGMVFNVKDDDYGAKGDGSTDDTAAFQAALSALSASDITWVKGTLAAYDSTTSDIVLGGAALYIPPGTYVISSTLTHHDGTRIYGSGAGSILSSTNNAAPILSCISHPDSPRPSFREAYYENFQTVGGLHGILWNNGVQHNSIRDVQVSSAASHGLKLIDCYSVVLDNVRSIKNGGSGIRMEEASGGDDGTTTRIIGGQVRKNSEHGVSIEGHKLLTVLGQEVNSNTKDGYKFLDVRGVYMAMCQIEDNEENGLSFDTREGTTSRNQNIGLYNMRFPSANLWSDISVGHTQDLFIWQPDIESGNTGLVWGQGNGACMVFMQAANPPSISTTDSGDTANYNVYSINGEDLINHYGNFVIGNTLNYKAKDAAGTARGLLRVDAQNDLNVGTASDLRDIQMWNTLVYATVTWDDGDLTPSVADGNVFVTNNSTPKTITDFDNSERAGTRITVYAGDGNTTIAHNASKISLWGAANITLSATSVLEFIKVAASGPWIQIASTV